MNEINRFKSSFPEDLYLPPQKFEEDYAQRVFFGYSTIKEKTATIGILARNLEATLDTVVLRILRLQSFFKDSRAIWLENGSKDKTRNKLIYHQNYSNRIIGEDNDPCADKNNKVIAQLDKLPMQGDKSFARKQRMALVRNLLRENMLLINSDYYIVIDADILGGFSYEGIANSFSYEWDVCGSNSLIYKEGKKYYYDSWAWRDIGHPEEHADEEINPREYFRGVAPIPVISCFGGVGIYKAQWYQNKKYRYNDTDCDHPTIHIPMYNDGAKIVMNPSQITLFNKTRYLV